MRTILVSAVCLLVACSSDSSNNNPAGGSSDKSGIDGSKAVGALSDDEKKRICDWTNARLGGYGKTVQCEGGVNERTDKDQAACLSELPPASCKATVAQTEACVNKLAATDPCSTTTEDPPECDLIASCTNTTTTDGGMGD